MPKRLRAWISATVVFYALTLAVLVATILIKGSSCSLREYP